MPSSPQDFKEKAAARRKVKDVPIEGVGELRFRALSAGDAQRFHSDVLKAKASGRNDEEMVFALVARSWIGEDGELWMPEAEGEAFARTLDPELYAEIVKEVLALNGLSKDAIEAAEKN